MAIELDSRDRGALRWMRASSGDAEDHGSRGRYVTPRLLLA